MSEPKADNKVQLGCGTLIVIAIIVMIFSGGRESRSLRESVEALNVKIDRLEQKIDDLSKRIPERPPAAPPGEAAK